jgi:hypothetical protein
MSKNVPTIPCGEFAVLVNLSDKGWKAIRCVGSIRLNGPGHHALRVLPPNGSRSSDGYPAEVEISADVDHSVMIEIRQLTGDRRMMTVWRQTWPGKPVSWSISLSTLGDVGPFRLVTYPELEQLFEYLISVK